MRTTSLPKTLISVAAVVGIATGSLVVSSTGYADPSTGQVSGADEIGTMAVVNLGLSTTQAKNLQRNFLSVYWGYTGAIDGQLGTNSWKAFQRCLQQYWGYTGAIDGIVGTGTIKALQRLLKSGWGYTGAIDGDAGSGTRAAFARMADGWA